MQTATNLWMQTATKIATVMFPFVVAFGVWLNGTIHAHEARLDVIEDSRVYWIERFVKATEKTEELFGKIDERLRNIEIRLGVQPKKEE